MCLKTLLVCILRQKKKHWHILR